MLDSEQLSQQQALEQYKGQQGNERGFRFLKDPLFFASSVFLKSPERIMALGLIMGLCLLVYNLGQRQLRQALQQADSYPAQSARQRDATAYLALDFPVFYGSPLCCAQWGEASGEFDR